MKMLKMRITAQIESDNFVKTKLHNKLNILSDEIDYAYEFQKYNTNYWKTFLPRLVSSYHMAWSPEKILNNSNISELTYKNYDKMLDVGIENSIYYALNIINDINYIVNTTTTKIERDIKITISTSCCKTPYKGDDKYEYINYFTDSKLNHNSNTSNNIRKNIQLLNDTIKLIHIIKDKKQSRAYNLLYEPLYKPSQMVYNLNFTLSPVEIKDMYLKYIDTGINKGKIHIYDKYGRCILSNDNKSDISQRSYSHQDYKKLNNIIVMINQVNTTTAIPDDNAIMFLTSIPELDTMLPQE